VTDEIRIDDVERFRSIIRTYFGLEFEEAKLGFLSEVLDRRRERNQESSQHYLLRLEGGDSAAELQALAKELTVGETYFFRHREQFRAFTDIVLSERTRAQADKRRIRILSAGCSSGDEAYTLAILLREHMRLPDWDATITAVDINPAALEKATAARYSRWALRETPADIQSRYFLPNGRDFSLDPSIHSLVRFSECNLAQQSGPIWITDYYDAIFCRNVMMYFSPDHARRLAARFADVLAPGGYLFLGHAETLRGLSQDFHLCHTHETFYYQRLGRSVSPSPGECLSPAAAQNNAQPPLADVVAGSTSWIDAIQTAAERIHTLSNRNEAEPAQSPEQSICDLTVPLELLRKERFQEALDVLQALPPDALNDADVLLLEAVLLTHRGRLAQAEEVCRRLLERGELNAGAHYILALCREASGDIDGAAHHDQTAAYLDPSFAMPRLHLGLLARRAEDRDTARRELNRALALLQREDASRLLLFGGGFTRDALSALCRAELLSCGGKI
jgi:chemotaxis protein methyltransferase CheR